VTMSDFMDLTDDVKDPFENKMKFEEPKLQFVEPKLTKQGDATKITEGFFGTFNP